MLREDRQTGKTRHAAIWWSCTRDPFPEVFSRKNASPLNVCRYFSYLEPVECWGGKTDQDCDACAGQVKTEQLGGAAQSAARGVLWCGGWEVHGTHAGWKGRTNTHFLTQRTDAQHVVPRTGETCPSCNTVGGGGAVEAAVGDHPSSDSSVATGQCGCISCMRVTREGGIAERDLRTPWSLIDSTAISSPRPSNAASDWLPPWVPRPLPLALGVARLILVQEGSTSVERLHTDSSNVFRS
jgi:hypothetical protein